MIFPTGMALSSRKRVLVFKLHERTFYPHQFLRLMILTRDWKVLERTKTFVEVKIGRNKLTLRPSYLSIVFSEWHSEWERYYLPSFSLSGKTVLDVGAGCGETALFYLTHGAEKVICVESDPECLFFLQENVRNGDWPVEVVKGFFSLKMLNYQFDFMKMDCEGCESLLLASDQLPPCIMEVHDDKTLQALTARFGLKTIGRSGPNWLACIMKTAQVAPT